MNQDDFSDLSDEDLRSSKGGQSRKGKKGGQGFASMNSDELKQVASKGGKAAHKKGTAHEFTSEEARAAGRKGGRR